MRSLDEPAFDQGLSEGGGECRAIGIRPGCERAAIELLAACRAGRSGASSIPPGTTDGCAAPQASASAIARFEMGRKPMEQDPLGWNPCVDAGIAFPRRGRAVLLRRAGTSGRDRRPNQGGHTSFEGRGSGRAGSAGQSPIRMPWSPTLDGVDGLVACVGKRRLVAAAEKVVRHENPSDADVRC